MERRMNKLSFCHLEKEKSHNTDDEKSEAVSSNESSDIIFLDL